MSRIGKQPVTIPEEVTLEVKDNQMKVSSKGISLTQKIPEGIAIEVKDKLATVTTTTTSNQTKAYHGLVRSLLFNMVEGVTKGGASAVLAASIFHFGEYTVAEAKAHMAAAGIPMRFT